MDEASNYVMKDGNVTVSGVLKDDGRGSVSEIVICYSLSATPNPEKCDGKITLNRDELDADNKFEVSFPKLKGNQKYYVIAYAKINLVRDQVVRFRLSRHLFSLQIIWRSL